MQRPLYRELLSRVEGQVMQRNEGFGDHCRAASRKALEGRYDCETRAEASHDPYHEFMLLMVRSQLGVTKPQIDRALCVLLEATRSARAVPQPLQQNRLMLYSTIDGQSSLSANEEARWICEQCG